MKSLPTRPSLPLAILLATAAICPLVSGQTIPAVPPEIVSAWKADVGNALLIFRYDGVYFQVQDEASRPGMERGTFTWNKATSAFSATTLRDTNGESGLSHPAGATTLSVVGNTLTYNVAGEGSSTFSRVVNTGTAIVGSWLIPGEQTSITFLANGSYFHAQESNDVPDGYDGMERGTYTWDSFSGVLTAVPITDTNGWSGLSDPEPSFNVTIFGNVMTLTEGPDIYILQRITTNPTPFSKLLGDFHVEKFANYIQSADAAPSALNNPGVGDYPFWGEAYVQTYVGATAPTLKIGTRTPQPFVLDPANNEFGIEQDNYASKAELDAATAFPDGTTYEFKSGSDTATLTFPASVEFPAVPKLLLGSGSWNAGSYQIDARGSLSWTGQNPFDPSKHATLLSIEDVTENPSVDLLKEFVIQGDVTSYDLAEKLVAGHDYWVSIEHLKIGSSTTSGTGIFAGWQGHAFHNTNTSFLLKATAEPVSSPVITQQPLSQLPAAGAYVTLLVGTAVEDHTLFYQWFKNGNPIPGQTGNSLSIRNYSNAANAGTYAVEVTNAAGSVTSALATLGPAVVKFVIVGKEVFYRQTDSIAVILDPSPVTPFNGGPYGFGANVVGQNMILLAAPVVTPPAGTPSTINDPFYNTLFFDGEDLEWRYGPNANDWGDLSQALIDTRFPNGTYTFLVNGVSVPLSLTGNAYPNTPQITLSGGTWINGKYAMDAANTLTVTTNTFTGYSSNIDGHISLEVNDSVIEYFKNSSPSTNFATYTAPPNTLPTDEVIEIEAGFDAIVNKSNAIPGAYCAAVYSKYVDVDVHILPKIITQSTSQALNLGASVDLQVTATGSPATATGSLIYQWKKDGADIPGLISSSFGIVNLTAQDAGTYTCTISNDVGSVVSSPISLSTSYVSVLGINRRQLATQQTASTTTAAGANFSVYVEGAGIGPTFPSSNMRISKPDSSLVSLISNEGRWELDNDFASNAAMLTTYPNGNYQIRIGGDSVPLTISNSSYPVQPFVTSSAGSWQAGKLQITASQAAAGFSLTTNVSNGDGVLDLSIYDSQDGDVYNQASTGSGVGQTLQVNIPGGTLMLGQTYSVEVEFDEVTGTADASSFSWASGATAFALLSSTTFITIEVVPNPVITPYTTWQSGFFNPAQLANPAISGDLADFDKDGVPNLLEYLLGGNPTLPSSGLLPTVTKAPGSSNLVFTYKRKIAATGVTQVIEHATNLSPPWTPAVHGASGVTIVTAAVPGDATAEQVTVTIPSVSTSRFVRLKANRSQTL